MDSLSHLAPSLRKILSETVEGDFRETPFTDVHIEVVLNCLFSLLKNLSFHALSILSCLQTISLPFQRLSLYSLLLFSLLTFNFSFNFLLSSPTFPPDVWPCVPPPLVHSLFKSLLQKVAFRSVERGKEGKAGGPL